jgi:outer membrane lipoprotein-sorting protein
MNRPTRRALRALAALACGAVLLAGCGDSSRTATTAASTTATTAGRPVTDEQALVLARLLQQNWQRGGATFAGTFPIQGTEVEMRGRVDFRDGRGAATLTDPTGERRRYVWTRSEVLAQSAPGASRYNRQAPDPDGDPVHATIRVINLLSAETIDNTTNIKDQDARLLRSETAGGTAVDVYRYGADGHTTYWVGHDDGLLRKIQARFPDGRVLTVTLTAHRPVRVKMPRTGR